MLSRGLCKLPSGSLSRFFASQGSRDAQLRALFRSGDPPQVRITSALANHFYAAAALATTETLPAGIESNQLQQIVRGLVAHDPRLLPVNLRALYLLHGALNIELSSAEKATFVDALIAYGDHEVTRSGLGLLQKVRGGPVPASALMALCAHAKAVDAPSLMVQLWRYLRVVYPRTVFQYSGLMVDLLEMFSRKERYRPLAREVAFACVGGELNPSLALAVAKVCYMLRDDTLAVALLAKLQCADPPINNAPITSALAQLDAALGRRPRQAVSVLPAQELSGVVKGVARRDLKRGEALVTAAMPETARRDRRKEKLAKAALCNQYIHEKDFEKFLSTVRELEALRLGSGVLLNLRITWELHHGTFTTAKRHYQNWGYIPLKQRAIALKALEALAAGNEDALQWAQAERRVHGLLL